ncbi:hypothetical protein VDT1_3562 [Vibrio sp. 16]|nr:hypothetical protein VPMS16_116 [Vibrio sp. 16]CAK4074718.1 hypothetical protein VDT1_3562 [Vibrio sp. 16]
MLGDIKAAMLAVFFIGLKEKYVFKYNEKRVGRCHISLV